MYSLKDLESKKNDLLIIHYACSSVTESPVIVSSISIKSSLTGQIDTFSLDEFKTEKELLQNFYYFLKNTEDKIFVTWNQKSSTYGIQYLSRRCKEHDISDSLPIDMVKVVDLDDLFAAQYGKNYVSHPKLRTLAELNHLQLENFVDGKNEIELLKKSHFKKIENSTNRKVGLIHDLMHLGLRDGLKTKKTIKPQESKFSFILIPRFNLKIGKETIVLFFIIGFSLFLVGDYIVLDNTKFFTYDRPTYWLSFERNMTKVNSVEINVNYNSDKFEIRTEFLPKGTNVQYRVDIENISSNLDCYTNLAELDLENNLLHTWITANTSKINQNVINDPKNTKLVMSQTCTMDDSIIPNGLWNFKITNHTKPLIVDNVLFSVMYDSDKFGCRDSCFYSDQLKLKDQDNQFNAKYLLLEGNKINVEDLEIELRTIDTSKEYWANILFWIILGLVPVIITIVFHIITKQKSK